MSQTTTISTDERLIACLLKRADEQCTEMCTSCGTKWNPKYWPGSNGPHDPLCPMLKANR